MPSTALWARIYGGFFFVAFALSVVMLLTDKNLQTDFGTMSSGYYFHWYVVLVTAVADVLGAVLLVLLASRLTLKAGFLGSSVLALVFLADIFTYSSVGFPSAGDFANYLFGVTYFGNDIRYLYDAILGVYLASAVFGVVALLKTRKPPLPAPV